MFWFAFVCACMVRYSGGNHTRQWPVKDQTCVPQSLQPDQINQNIISSVSNCQLCTVMLKISFFKFIYNNSGKEREYHTEWNDLNTSLRETGQSDLEDDKKIKKADESAEDERVSFVKFSYKTECSFSRFTYSLILLQAYLHYSHLHSPSLSVISSSYRIPSCASLGGETGVTFITWQLNS